MSKEITKEGGTLLQTIRARLEWGEKGEVKAIWDANGDFEICERTQGGLVRYFNPEYVIGIDVYGNESPSPINPPTNEQ